MSAAPEPHPGASVPWTEHLRAELVAAARRLQERPEAPDRTPADEPGRPPS